MIRAKGEAARGGRIRRVKILCPILMGSGENLFAGIDMTALGYHCTGHVSTEHATHVVLVKQA
jgi:hypothetical protein